MPVIGDMELPGHQHHALSRCVPAWLGGRLDAYASETLFACLMGVVLVPLVIPWGYVHSHYIAARGEPWRAPSA